MLGFVAPKFDRFQTIRNKCQHCGSMQMDVKLPPFAWAFSLTIKCLYVGYNKTVLLRKKFGSTSWDTNGIGSSQVIVHCSVRRNETLQLVDGLYTFAKQTLAEKGRRRLASVIAL